MFNRLRKALSREAKPAAQAAPASAGAGPMADWAQQHGLVISSQTANSVVIECHVGSTPCRMELGKPSRNYIQGEELRARAELGLDEDLTALVMNRPLKEALERKAYSMITDTLQTTADPNLPEEMRWLAMYDEVGWETLPAEFWGRYAVLTDRREHAMAWLDETLADLLLDWPAPAPNPQTPFMVILLRGKLYLRMEFSPAEVTTVQHAARIFQASCESALGAFEGYTPPR